MAGDFVTRHEGTGTEQHPPDRNSGSLIGLRFTREQWGACDMSVGDTSKPGYAERCNRPATFVAKNEDEDGNHSRYCIDCVRAA